MTEEDLFDSIRTRIKDPKKRIEMTTVDIPPLYGAASKDALDATEAKTGVLLPRLLRGLYSKVGNGGFGPSAGIVGVDGGHPDVNGNNLGALYLALRAQWWPEGLLPLCDWGGGAWACVDSDGRIVTMDEAGPTRTPRTLLSWLEAWLAGVNLVVDTFEITDAITMNPFTKKPIAVKRRGRAKGISA